MAITLTTTSIQNQDSIIQADCPAWADLRDLWYGRDKRVMDAFFTRMWPDAMQSGAIVPIYAETLNWAAKWLVPSAFTDWTYSGSAEVVKLLKAWEPAIKTARCIRRLAGMSWLHYAHRRDPLTAKVIPSLEVLWGDQMQVDVDPYFPAAIQACQQIAVAMGPGWLLYQREDGVVTAAVKTDDRATPVTVPASQYYPIYGWYLWDRDHVMPGMRQAWLAHAKAVSEMLTDADHTRRNLPGQDILTTDSKDQREGQAVPRGSDKIMVLTTGETYDRKATPGIMSEQLAAIKTYLKIHALLAGLPPETVDVESYSQTGAAKAIDAAPAWDIRIQCWRETQRDLDELLLELAPRLEASGYDVTGMRIEIPEPKAPAIGDPLHREQAAQARIDRGVDSAVDEIMREQEVDRPTAEAIYRRNRSYLEDSDGNQGQATPDVQTPDASDGRPASGDPVGDPGSARMAAGDSTESPE